MRILAIDTALGQCAAAILDVASETTIAAEAIAMERGHAEALLPLLDRVMARVDGGFHSLDRVAVTIGPGSFTGLRIGISAARAVALAIGIPAVGVTTLSALMAPLMEDGPKRLTVAAIDARGGRVFVQAIGPSGRLIIQPCVMTIRDVVRNLGSGSVALVGPGATMIAAEARAVGIDAVLHDDLVLPDLAWVARIGAAAEPDEALAKPYYLAAPDARPQDGARLARL
ncbi:tRNA (adenosine(37)-N6)-threonylcarbamoyltransferase complex dimerization subunit type 1 TsaB [Enterovirga rhinocerotis]|uniref:tRNA threonylcarbamoyl adenosine modification protein YeaZ n=1 Tax=Enterovirga rhinocerotis TaxID=1339210 RepID=A0A4R7BNR5_9HYPH|nr:tRNA (adenosine(37)-N6)-threonylcarbamoyltransferase complex dimerization subunit type 1 TsaB [Enterovirga rhinocerotis]TDR87164.1 tRNA threonylcarbamoyl adenosine modification protein YeaZ [Enterovirga rhinocerotis]